MRPDLDEKLVADFPRLYRERHGDRYAKRMSDGFPGDGWYELIRRMSEKIEPFCAGDLRCAQIKEKMGRLRVYFESSEPIPDEVSAAVGAAVRESEVTCEGCGEPGRAWRGHWRRTLCDTCTTFAEEWERHRFPKSKQRTPDDQAWLDQFRRGEFGVLLPFEEALGKWRANR